MIKLYLYSFQKYFRNASPSSSLLSSNLLKNQSTLVYNKKISNAQKQIFQQVLVLQRPLYSNFSSIIYRGRGETTQNYFPCTLLLELESSMKGSGNCADPCCAGFACQGSQITSVTHCGCCVLKTRKSNFLITCPFPHTLTFANPSCNFPLKQHNLDFLFQQDRLKYLQSFCHLSS